MTPEEVASNPRFAGVIMCCSVAEHRLILEILSHWPDDQPPPDLIEWEPHRYPYGTREGRILAYKDDYTVSFAVHRWVVDTEDRAQFLASVLSDALRCRAGNPPLPW